MTPKEHERGDKFRMPLLPGEKITSEKVRNFVNDYKEGRLGQDYKSEPKPAFVTPPMQVR